MKIGKVILALCIWGFGGFFVLAGVSFLSLNNGDIGTETICLIVFFPVLIVFIVGLMVLLKGRETTSQPSTPSSSKSIRYCPKCGREIPFDAVVCPYCQYDFK